jgi:hypothetical protein
MTMFDIADVSESQVGTLKLKHPLTGALTGAEIDLAGPSHPKRRKIEFDRARNLRAKMAKRGRLEMTDPEDDEEYQLDRLAGITLGWRGIVKDGREIPVSAGAARSLYEVSWIRQQADEYLVDDTNFLASAATLSSSESGSRSASTAG